VKPLTRAQLESRKEKAVRFTRDVLGDPDRAEEIADESLEDYGPTAQDPDHKSNEKEKRTLPAIAIQTGLASVPHVEGSISRSIAQVVPYWPVAYLVVDDSGRRLASGLGTALTRELQAANDRWPSISRRGRGLQSGNKICLPANQQA